MNDVTLHALSETTMPEMPDDTHLTPLEPGFAHAVRIGVILNCLPLIIGAAVLDFAVLRTWTLGIPVVLLMTLALSLCLILFMPARRLNSWGYALSADQLRVVRGVVFHTDTIVPFVRVQHIDVGRGPIERIVGTATLTVHTAGNHNSIVSLPGLSPETAESMRDSIRAQIKTDFM